MLVLCVQWQVVGRYLLNDSPTWTGPVALLVLYITALGRGGGRAPTCRHLGMSAGRRCCPAAGNVAEGLIHLCVLVFAVLRWPTPAGEWLTLKWTNETHAGVPEGWTICRSSSPAR